MGTTCRIWMVHRTGHGALHMPQGIHPQNKIGTNIRHSRVPPPQKNMPKMSSTDATIYAAHDLILGLQNPAPASPLFTLGNTHKE